MMPTTFPRHRILSASIASLVALSATASAQLTWDGETSINWNTPTNWDGDIVPSGLHAIINTNTGNVATIFEDIVATPIDIFVGNALETNGLLNHTAGTARTGLDNWMYVGVNGGTGTYNIANTNTAGGTLTGFGQGSGSILIGNTGAGTGGRLYVGGDHDGGAGIGTVNVNTSGTMAIRNDLAVGSSGGTGVMNVDSGTITTGGWNFIGKNEGGAGGNGTFNMSGGTLINTGRTYVGQTGATGKIELTGSGKYRNINNELFIVGEGAGSSGEIIVNGANAELLSEGDLWIGQAAGGNGKMTVTAGTVSVGNWLAVGREGATGVLTINGGLVQKTDTDGSLEITNAGSTTASGIVNLNGGTLRVNNITGSGGVGSVANLYLNGGTLKPTVGNGNFISGNVVPLIKNGGAIIDTDSFNITIQKSLDADAGSTGGLTKTGAGILTLTAGGTYAGPTVVSGGTLQLDSNAAIDSSSGILVSGAGATLVHNSFVPLTPLVTVTNGALNGTGTFNDVTVTEGGSLINAAGATGALNIETLTFNGAATLALQTTSGAPVSILADTLVTGATNAAGKVTLNLSNPDNLWATGSYSLIGYSTLGGAGFAGIQTGTIAGLGARQSAALTNAAGVIGLAITGDLPIWTGAQNGNWTTAVIGGLSNWKLDSNGLPTDFIAGDTVLFDDTATGTTTVNISTANVTPTSVTFDNDSKSYTVTSSGGFGIATGSLTKSGTGAVTLTTANTYAGGTRLNEGTLNINHSSAIGTGPFRIVGGTIDNTSGAAITLTANNPVVLEGDLTFTGTNALNLGTGPVTLVSSEPTKTLNIFNNSTLPGTPLTIGGPVTGTGGAAYTLNISGTGNTALTGNVTIGAGSSLVINNTLPGTLTLSGAASRVTTLNMNGGASSIVELGAGNLTIANGGGSTLQSVTGGRINATGGGSLVLGSDRGDIGTAGETTLTINAKISGAAGPDFYNANGGAGLGTIILAAANDYTGTTQVENTRVVLPTGGAINGPNTAGVGLVNVGTVGGARAELHVNGGTINANSGGISVNVGTANGASGLLNFDAGSINAGEVWIGGGDGSFGSFQMSGGTFNANAWFVVGRNSNGSAELTGGTLNVTNRNFITASTNVRAATHLTGNTVVNVTGTGGGNGSVFVGEAHETNAGLGEVSLGELTISGNAQLNIAGAEGVFLGNNAGGSGTVNFNGGTVSTVGVKKGAGSGFANFDGGTLVARADSFSFMQGLDSAYVNEGGVVVDDGGFAIDINQPLLAPTGSGIASITASGSDYVGTPLVEIEGDGTGATAVANMDNAGNLTGFTITNPGVGYTEATVNVIGGGGLLNDIGIPVFAPNVSGGFTKRGAGTVTLSGENTYTGATVVEAGTLAITGSIAGSTSISTKAGATLNVAGFGTDFAVASNQTLAGRGTVVGNTNLSAGAKLAPGDGGAGTLTFAGDLDLTLAINPANSGALQFELGSLASSDKIAFSTGGLTIGNGVLGFGDFTFTALAGLQEGTYTLFDGNTAIDGTLDLANLTGSLGGPFTGTLGIGDAGKDLVLTVVPEPGSATLLLAGLSSVLGLRRFRRRSA